MTTNKTETHNQVRATRSLRKAAHGFTACLDEHKGET